VAVHTSVVTGTLTSLAPDAGSGLAGRAALIVILLAAASGVWLVTARRAARFRPSKNHPLPGRTGAPVSLIYNGVDLARYDHTEPCCTFREQYGIEPDAVVVGVVARLEPEKGHPTLLQAWPAVLRAVPNAALLVVGEGSRYAELERLAASLRIAHRVVFTGRRDDVPSVTAALDVAVLPSYREAQGLSILEAMALSRPVVASRVGGIPEVIEDGVSGLLVPPRDPEALAGAIIRLLKDHPYADMIGRAGHDVVHERFCIGLMVRAVETIYDEGARTVRISGAVAS